MIDIFERYLQSALASLEEKRLWLEKKGCGKITPRVAMRLSLRTPRGLSPKTC